MRSRLRRSAGGILTPEPGMLLHLRKGDFVSANGVISQWNDSSGNGYHLTQSTAANRPIDGSVGDDLVVNGDFATDSDWTKNNFTIGSGVATANGTGGFITQTIALEANTNYLITYQVTAITSGNAKCQFRGGSAQDGVIHSSAGTYSDVLNSSNNNALAIVSGGTTPDASIDNVTVQKITPDGTAYFDGIQRSIAATIAGLEQPVIAFILYKPITWTANKVILSGVGGQTVFVRQRVSSPRVGLYAGAGLDTIVGPTIGEWGINTAAADSTNSLIQTDNGTPLTGNGGTQDPGGITIGADNGANFSNIQVAEVLVYSGALNEARRFRNIKYMAGIEHVQL